MLFAKSLINRCIRAAKFICIFPCTRGNRVTVETWLRFNAIDHFIFVELKKMQIKLQCVWEI